MGKRRTADSLSLSLSLSLSAGTDNKTEDVAYLRPARAFLSKSSTFASPSTTIVWIAGFLRNDPSCFEWHFRPQQRQDDAVYDLGETRPRPE